MRLVSLVVLLPMLIPAGVAHAQTSLFGSADRVPANPFASNYASPPVRATGERERRVRQAPRPQPLRPPRDIPR